MSRRGGLRPGGPVYEVSDELAIVLGTGEGELITRPKAVQKMWDYMKRERLQDRRKGHRRFFTPDANMAAIWGPGRQLAFGASDKLGEHMWLPAAQPDFSPSPAQPRRSSSSPILAEAVYDDEQHGEHHGVTPVTPTVTGVTPRKRARSPRKRARRSSSTPILAVAEVHAPPRPGAPTTEELVAVADDDDDDDEEEPSTSTPSTPVSRKACCCGRK